MSDYSFLPASESSEEETADDSPEILQLSEKGNVDAVMQLIQGDPQIVNLVDSDRYTPLHRAAYNNHIDVIKVLLKAGAQIGAKTIDGWTPLHSASKWNNYKVVSVLLDAGADVNAVTDSGQTPLHLAALNRDAKETIEVLIVHPRVNLSRVNSNGETAKQLAVRSGPYAHMFNCVGAAYCPF